MTDGELKTVATFTEKISAEITAGMLNENGIPAAVFGENSAYPSIGVFANLEVKVNADDYDEAMKILAAPVSESDLDVE